MNMIPIRRGSVAMRRITCESGYSSRTFKTALMHEVGHALGLGHPDQAHSPSSSTTPEQWASAVMTSIISGDTPPDTAQADDVQAMQFYYPSGPLPTVFPVADFTVGPATAGNPVQFTDTTTNNPTGWFWFFAEPGSDLNVSREQNPTHTYANPGTYGVRLTAGNANGGGTILKTITVLPGQPSVCTPSSTTLCLNDGRFQVRARWRRNDGTTGEGTAVELTNDTGYFWFFNSENIEVVTKVLGACIPSLGNSYWVFSAGLTNVEVTLTYVDTAHGITRTYVNPLGQAYQPIQDTAAFQTCP
jgi:hypothetical protein